MRCTNWTGRDCLSRTILLNSICALASPAIRNASQRRKTCGKSQDESIIGCKKCDIEIPEKIRGSFANIPTIF